MEAEKKLKEQLEQNYQELLERRKLQFSFIELEEKRQKVIRNFDESQETVARLKLKLVALFKEQGMDHFHAWYHTHSEARHWDALRRHVESHSQSLRNPTKKRGT